MPFKCSFFVELKLKLLKVNLMILSYVFWNEHEQTEGIYDFSDKNDLVAFMKLAQDIGFVVIFRAGPYSCGEHEYGGFPWWLLKNGADSISPRSNDPAFMNAVKKWFGVLLPLIYPLLYENGGPVIMVQVSNSFE